MCRKSESVRPFHFCRSVLFRAPVLFPPPLRPQTSVATMRTSAALAAVMAVAVLASASAHTCLLNPMQRGGAANATTTVADPLCGVGTGPWYAACAWRVYEGLACI